jgi:hypothetical protein
MTSPIVSAAVLEMNTFMLCHKGVNNEP